MTDEEKFIGLKQQHIKENEQTYGAELRQKYGAKSINATNQHWLSLSQEELQTLTETEQSLIDTLQTALITKDRSSETMKKIFDIHKSWLTSTMPNYSADLHQALGWMYVQDPRFTAYYETRAGIGAAILVNDSIQQALST